MRLKILFVFLILILLADQKPMQDKYGRELDKIDIIGRSLWINIQNGKVNLEPSDEITTFNSISEISLPHKDVALIGSDTPGKTWIGFDKNIGENLLVKYDGQSWFISTVSNPGIYESNTFFIAVDPEGHYWFGIFNNNLVDLWMVDWNNTSEFLNSQLLMENKWYKDKFEHLLISAEELLTGSQVRNSSTDMNNSSIQENLNFPNDLAAIPYPQLSSTVYTLSIDGTGNKWIGVQKNITGIHKNTPTIEETGGQDEELAAEFSLESNYPNPFNPATKIKYSINADKRYEYQEVRLVVYDILGREAETLVNKNQRQGNYEIIWDASDFPSGIYFYRLSAGKYTETKKMILLK